MSLDAFKIKTAKSLFTNAINKAKKKHKAKNVALIIKADDDYNPSFLIYADTGIVQDEAGGNKIYKIDELLNTFDIATLELARMQFKFDLIEEISELLEKYCEKYNIQPGDVTIMFQIKQDNNAYPLLYNGMQKVRQITYEEIFANEEEENEEDKDESENEPEHIQINQI